MLCCQRAASRGGRPDISHLLRNALQASQLRLLLFHVVAMVDLPLVPHALQAARDSVRERRAFPYGAALSRMSRS